MIKEDEMFIKIRRPSVEIPYYTETMTLLQAKAELRPIKKYPCINCEEQCSDCYISYKEKIAIEKLLDYLDKINIKRKIKGFKK